MKLSNPKSGFAHVNGIRLHYLDWGGNGPALIFLTGMGSSAYIYGGFAPLFTDGFHVLALTRRGHGDSDYPETGYDPDTLVEDIRQFMDALNIKKAILAGHSLAGVELTHFVATHPERVEKLVYLDALDDRRSLQAIQEQSPLKGIEIKTEESSPHTFEEYIADLKRDLPYFAEIWSAVWEQEFFHNSKVNEAGVFVDKMPASVEAMMIKNLIKGYVPKQVEAEIPTLIFYAFGMPTLQNGYTEEQKASYGQYFRNVREPVLRSVISDFQNRFPHAKIVEVPNGHHYCFMVQEELVYGEMRKFLLDVEG